MSCKPSTQNWSLSYHEDGTFYGSVVKRTWARIRYLRDAANKTFVLFFTGLSGFQESVATALVFL